MTIVTVAFVISWFPNNIFFVIFTFSPQVDGYLAVGYYPTVFLIYLNICLNPFIYAAKHEGVKGQLARMMVCRKWNDIANAPGNNRAGGTQQTGVGDARNSAETGRTV